MGGHLKQSFSFEAGKHGVNDRQTACLLCHENPGGGVGVGGKKERKRGKKTSASLP